MGVSSDTVTLRRLARIAAKCGRAAHVLMPPNRPAAPAICAPMPWSRGPEMPSKGDRTAVMSRRAPC